VAAEKGEEVRSLFPDARDVIARMITLSGQTLLLAVEPLSDDVFFAENDNGFSAAWVLGHGACFPDLFSSWFTDTGLLLGAEFHAVFNETAVVAAGPVSKAASVDRERFPKEELMLRFREASTKALRVLRGFNVTEWDSPAPPGAPLTLRTAGDVWERLAVHSYWHNGELSGSMETFRGTYTLNIEPHHLYVPMRTGDD